MSSDDSCRVLRRFAGLSSSNYNVWNISMHLAASPAIWADAKLDVPSMYSFSRSDSVHVGHGPPVVQRHSAS